MTQIKRLWSPNIVRRGQHPLGTTSLTLHDRRNTQTVLQRLLCHPWSGPPLMLHLLSMALPIRCARRLIHEHNPEALPRALLKAGQRRHWNAVMPAPLPYAPFHGKRDSPGKGASLISGI